MSFVGGPFEHDVFITYSHGDAAGDGQSMLKHWSEGFAAELERELNANADADNLIKVFRDQHLRPDQGLDPNMPLTEEIKSQISKSAALAILMTPQYLASTWCADERDWWQQVQQEAGLSADGRQAVARIWPTGDRAWPEDLVDSRGHELPGRWFFDRAEAEDIARPYDWPQPHRDSRDPFRSEIVRYAGNLRKHLSALKAFLEAKAEEARDVDNLTAEAGQAIYLHGRAENGQLWQEKWSELDEAGYSVYPAEPDPVTDDRETMYRISKARVDMLSGCDALLLLGTDDIWALNADLVVVGRTDRHRAREYSNKLLPCAVVDTANLMSASDNILKSTRRLGVDWLSAADRTWTGRIGPWLSGAAR